MKLQSLSVTEGINMICQKRSIFIGLPHRNKKYLLHLILDVHIKIV